MTAFNSLQRKVVLYTRKTITKTGELRAIVATIDGCIMLCDSIAKTFYILNY